ncbi:MAG TPA: 3-(methylthio)propionyl-CoA ligase [Casimicrobiaceae bacterium]|nr:3-(methylthio)propionyl-CoA ligase [Casimicrobiaceae bacterium]
MNGNMMQMPLLISALIRHADRYHGDVEIVSRPAAGRLFRYTYRDAHRRARQLAKALLALGVRPSSRVGTLAWNTHRHFELYFGASGIGAVIHTTNPRLFPEQVEYIVNHAEDELVFFDLPFLPLVERIAPRCPSVRAWIALCDRESVPASALPVGCYDELVDAQDDHYTWPQFDENTAASLCYTSGTTGNPKGALFAHRSTLLHTFGICLPDGLALSARDVIMPVTPMFHVFSWGLPYGAAMVGAKLVLPGAQLDGASLYELFEKEAVTLSSGVPTVWLGLLQHLEAHKLTLTTLKRLIIGGSACPPAMFDKFAALGIEVIHAWGMTETSPVSTTNQPKAKHLALPADQLHKLRTKQGRPGFGVDLKIVDGEGRELPRDGVAFGDLMVRGPWVVAGYFKGAGGDVLRDGWFPTGDVATLDADGFVQITDRSKDIIKSGGEWISSIDIENFAVAHPAVAEAAVIGVAHPKWDERPLLVLVRKEGAHVSRAEMLDFLRGKVVKWWLPDDVIFVDSLPHTATGKLSKLMLRQQLKDYRWPESAAAPGR